MVGSHRSLVDSHTIQAEQPNCLEGLRQLNAHKIHYLDLDLIYDPAQQQLVVAHPMEFTGATQLYSPCAKQPLETLLQLLEQAMPQSAWFVSLEPKANWERLPPEQLQASQSVLQAPMVVLEQTLMVVQKLNLQPSQCTLYIDATQIEPVETAIATKLSKYCSLALAMKRDNGEAAKRAARLWHYDYLMPTIEYHPSHPNYQATAGVDALRDVQQSISKTVYWVVDTSEDLERTAQLQGYNGGIVSNRPLEMVRLLIDSQSKWCPKQHLRSKT